MEAKFDPLPSCFSGVTFLPIPRLERLVQRSLQKWQKHFGSAATLPIDIESLVEVVEGIEVDYITEHSEFDSNVLGAYDFSQKKLFVRDVFEHEGRRRFTWAHEYGHFVLHSPYFLQKSFDFFESGNDSAIQLNRGSLDKRNILEWQANQFASNILMPSPLVLAFLRQHDRSLGADDLVYQLASAAKVSKQAARIRLEQLAVIPKTK